MSDVTMLGPMPEDEATLAFFSRVLPAKGVYALAPRRGKTVLSSVFCFSLEELTKQAFTLDADNLDVYFTVAALHSNANRKAENIHSLRTLRLDIDSGVEGHAVAGPYKNTDEAAKALALFCKNTGMPTPIVNDTGGGLHAYWPLDVDLTPEEWKPYAEGLKHLCARHGLVIDAPVTSDAARVLRVPGTHNRKTRNIRKVETRYLNSGPYPLSEFDFLLKVSGTGKVVCMTPRALLSTLGPMPGHLLAKTRPAFSVAAPATFAPAYGERVADKCAQLAAMRDHKGVMPYGEWFACIGVLAWCVDGDKLGHEWSAGDERYDAVQTQAKLDDCRRSKGPVTCAYFRGVNSLCSACTHNVVTPKTLGESLLPPDGQQAEAIPLAPPRFASFEKGANGLLKRGSLVNASLSLSLFGVVCRLDVFHSRATVQHPDLKMFGEKFCDAHTRALRIRMISEHDHDPGFDTCWQAIKTQCESNHYDPIVEYLDGLKWDGQGRIDHWLSRYLGADNTPLHRAFGRKTLLAAVRRTHQPGAKFDFMLVLEGSQGTGKSSAARILAGDDNFSDQKLLHLDTKAQAEQIAGKWIYEISELAGLHGRAVEDVKQFIARQSDEARPAYGREVEERLRRCIFIGTTNNTRYLHDETGNRRFWPVRTGVIDLEALAQDRDQIWAEAQHYASKGESLGLDPSLWSDAGRAQEERRQEDPWEEVLRGVKGHAVDHTPGEFRVTSTELFFAHLKMTADKLTTGQSKRLSTVMNTLGWTGPRTLRVEGEPVRGYFRKT